MFLIQAITVVMVLGIDLGIALKCKTGNCKNSKEVSGCQTKFEDMDCKSDHVCYREQQQPYGIDEEVLISSGCISTKDGSRDPLVLPGPNWQLVGPIFNKTLTVDEINNNINKECVERDITVTPNDHNVTPKIYPKIVDACMCDKDLCNAVSSAGIFGINLVHLGMISRF